MNLSDPEEYIKKLEKWYEDLTKKIDIEESIPKIETNKIDTNKIESEQSYSKTPGYNILYCMECISKHLAASEKLADEAMTFSRSGECDKSIGWIREVVKELAGMEVDVKYNAPKEILEIVDDARRIRRKISELKLEYVCNTDGIAQIIQMIRDLRQKFYKIAPQIY